MSFTNQTPNYGLPQWLAADKPKFLTDINIAFSTIDTQLKNANDTANAANDSATSALTIAGQAANTAESAATVAGQAAALAQSVNELVGTLNAKMGTTSIATIGDGTVTGAIDAINDDIGNTSIATIGDGTVTGAIDVVNSKLTPGYSEILEPYRTINSNESYTAVKNSLLYVSYDTDQNTGYHVVQVNGTLIAMLSSNRLNNGVGCIPLAKGDTVTIGANATYATHYMVISLE